MDGMPILGETPEVKGLWSCAAVWIKEGPGTGRAVAEWMVRGWSDIDIHASNIARFYEHQKSRKHVKARVSESFIKTYGIVHPAEQYMSNRNVRLSPFYKRESELGAVFYEVSNSDPTTSRAQRRTHTPLADAVRAAVISTQSMTAVGTPVAASLRMSSPLM